MPGEYNVGDLVRTSTEFTDPETGDGLDPDDVFCRYVNPSGAVVTLQYGVDVALVRDGLGRYHVDINITAAGNWYYRWFSTGNGQGTEERGFTVKSSLA